MATSADTDRATTSTTSSVDDEAAPLPGFRAKGSFHPSAGQGGTSRAPPPQPAPSSAEEVVVSSRPRALGLWSVLLVGVVCLATLLVFLSVLDRPDLWVHVTPNALSIVGSLTICCCWLALPELRTTHGGHVFCIDSICYHAGGQGPFSFLLFTLSGGTQGGSNKIPLQQKVCAHNIYIYSYIQQVAFI